MIRKYPGHTLDVGLIRGDRATSGSGRGTPVLVASLINITPSASASISLMDRRPDGTG